MNIEKWMVINSKGGARLAVKMPRLNPSEIAFQIQFVIPQALFHRPLVRARIEIPENVVLTDTITPEITDNIEEAIKSVTGLEMRVSVVEPEEGDSL